MLSVDVIERPQAAAAALDPVRSRLLAALARPGSASSLAATLGMPRQLVNYHLRILEAHELVRLVEARPRRGLTERIMQATAASYVVSPAAMGDAASDPDRETDRLSAGYLVALAARAVREVGDLLHRARAAGKRLPTLSLDTEIRFRSPQERAAFTDELAAAVTSLVARYHDANAPDGRRFRLLVAAHPVPRVTAVVPTERTVTPLSAEDST